MDNLALPFTTRCDQKHQFPGEHGFTPWRCTAFDGHDGPCVPSELEQRLYDRREAYRQEVLPAGTYVLDSEVLRKVVELVISETSDSDGLDSGVMWLRIQRILGFNALIQMLTPTPE
jgi:hypothetical protein